MGGGNTKQKKKEEDIQNTNTSVKLKKKNSYHNSKSPIITTYKLFQYKNNSQFSNTNSLMYTSYDNSNNDFNILDGKYNEILRSNIYKTNGVAIGYSKGNKIDPNNQDKFFILLDGCIEVFCIIDGHGPYGNILAQTILDKIFKVLI